MKATDQKGGSKKKVTLHESSIPLSCRQFFLLSFCSTFSLCCLILLGFPGGSVVKTLPAMQETQVQVLGPKDPLEKGMATYSSILAWRIPWTEEPGRLQSMELQRVRHD